jgi:hypothetical protein
MTWYPKASWKSVPPLLFLNSGITDTPVGIAYNFLSMLTLLGEKITVFISWKIAEQVIFISQGKRNYVNSDAS